MSQNDLQPLTLDVIRTAISGTAAAFRCVTKYQPAGGPSEKVFPPTYAGGKYATEERRIDGAVVPCVLLDSVQSQANRMEETLLQAYDAGQLRFPLMVVDFSRTEDDSVQNDPEVARIGRISTLDAPHRIADAIFRDSVLNNETTIRQFRESREGQAYENANIRNATALLELCPTALIFGTWDSTSLGRRSPGNKFARVLVSEIVGVNATLGVRTSSRIDPLDISSQARIFDDGQGDWTLENTGTLYGRSSRTPGRPSLIVHGNVTPDVSESGGVTIDYALQTTVLSLAGLRRLRFPGQNGQLIAERNVAARTVLTTLALIAMVSHCGMSCDLRSRCLLMPTESSQAIELVTSGADCQSFALTVALGVELFTQAVQMARAAGFTWQEDALVLRPMNKLVGLIQESRRAAMQAEGEGA